MKRLAFSDKKLSFRFSNLLNEVRGGEACPVGGIMKLFSLGYELEDQGEIGLANTVYFHTIEFAEELLSDDSNKVTPHHVAKIAYSHGLQLLKLTRYSKALESLNRSAEMFKELVSDGVTTRFLHEYSRVLNAIAICQRSLGKHKEGLMTAKKCLSYLEGIACFSPKSATKVERDDLTNEVRSTLLEISICLEFLGRKRLAQSYQERAMQLLLQ